jgi:mannan polymerase II complex ANP1 subunit
MKFSVVGLPHYTVWHLYEPSVDDIRHMEEMAQEQKAREKEEKEKAERQKKIKDAYKETGSQWEKDKTELQSLAEKEENSKKQEKIVHVGNEQGPIAKSVKEPTDPLGAASKPPPTRGEKEVLNEISEKIDQASKSIPPK